MNGTSIAVKNMVTVLTVTDLHQDRRLYEELAHAVTQHKPDIVAIVGDCLHAGEDMQGRLSVTECAKRLHDLPCQEVVFVRGNHEDENWTEFAEYWRKRTRPLHTLHGDIFKIGPLCILGFPCYMGDESHFLEKRKPLFGASKWIRALSKVHGDALTVQFGPFPSWPMRGSSMNPGGGSTCDRRGAAGASARRLRPL